MENIYGYSIDLVVSSGPVAVTDPRTGLTHSYLDVFLHPANEGVDQPSNGKLWFGAGLSPFNCYAASQMLAFAAGWPQNVIDYSPAGPNSNTISHLLAAVGGINVAAPPGSYGW